MVEPREPFVCPWCGARFAHRFIPSDRARSLEEHWELNQACSANRAANNPTQSKYDQPLEPPPLRLLGPEDRDG